MKRDLAAVLNVVVLAVLTSSGYAQDAGRITFENDQVRAIEYAVAPSAEAKLQARAPYIYLCLTDSMLSIHGAGKNQTRWRCKFEDTRWFDQALASIRNEGQETAKFLIVEILNPAPTGLLATDDDGTKIAAEQYQVLLENDRVRVIRVNVRPGQKTRMHSHPGSTFRYGLKEGSRKWRFTFPDGRTLEQGAEAPTKGLWSDKPSSHIIENIGQNDIHNVLVELK